MKRPTKIFAHRCPRCGGWAEVREYLRAFTNDMMPTPIPFVGLFTQGRIKMTCEKCGKISDVMWNAIIDCYEIDDKKIDKVRDIYYKRMEETWDRMSRGEPEPDPGPSNCEYITFEGMYY